MSDGLILLKDNLDVLRQLPDNYIELVYIDPPFGTGKTQVLRSMKDHDFTGEELEYTDLLTGEDYINFLGVRLQEIHRVLTYNGSIYLHLDHRYSYLIRPLLDKIFGADHFLNEIIWAYDYGGRPKDRWPKKHDTILWYKKGTTHVFNYDQIERIPYMAPGLVGPEKAAIGKLPTDVWWMTIVPTNGYERTGYPTQKPEKLMTRIITASSKPGHIVADFFCGSGTFGAVAKQLNRKYILVDSNPEAIRITRKRLGVS